VIGLHCCLHQSSGVELPCCSASLPRLNSPGAGRLGRPVPSAQEAIRGVLPWHTAEATDSLNSYGTHTSGRRGRRCSLLSRDCGATREHQALVGTAGPVRGSLAQPRGRSLSLRPSAVHVDHGGHWLTHKSLHAL
jgi:hypothetical protein